MQTVPYSEEFERALIIGILSDTSLIPRVSSILEEKDFFKEYHKEIYKVILNLNVSEVDSLTVQDKLSEKTKEYFKDLVNYSDAFLPSLTNIMVYAETIKDKSKLRAGIDLGRDITALCYEDGPAGDTLQTLEDMFARFLQNRVTEDKSANTREAFKEFISSLGTKVDDVGIQTGFYGIDMIINKLEGLIVLAGRPSTGKTALSINIARYVAQTKPVVFFSLEQTRESIFERMLAAEAEVNTEEIRTGAYLGDENHTRFVKDATERLIPILENIHVDDNAAVNTSYITSVSRQKRFEWGDIGLIVVDYLHIMKLNDKANKVDALGDAVKELRALGKELKCPVLLLSQLSRQSDTQPFAGGDHQQKRHRRPELTDLRSSGEIEQSADIVLFLYRESYYDQLGQTPAEDVVEVIVRKNRNGRIGIGTLGWVPRFVKFKDI